MKYDPTGQYVLTCAVEDKVVKAWLPRRDGLVILYKLFHESPVTGIQWCSLLGKGDNKKLMMARYAWFYLFIYFFFFFQENK